jgi:hypothetical protein
VAEAQAIIAVPPSQEAQLPPAESRLDGAGEYEVSVGLPLFRPDGVDREKGIFGTVTSNERRVSVK